MRAAALLEVVENAAVELVDLAKALADQPGRSLFAAYAAGAESDDGLSFNSSGSAGVARGKSLKDFNPSESAFSNVPRSTSNWLRYPAAPRSPLVQPALEFLRREPRRRRRARMISGRCMETISRLIFTSRRLNGCPADQLRLTSMEAKRASAQCFEKRLDVRGGARKEQVDAFPGDEDGALQPQLFAARLERGAQLGQVVEGDESVGGDVENIHGTVAPVAWWSGGGNYTRKQ